jgi:outer membrane protein OmpA-like peptidoglycan-associated protein
MAQDIANATSTVLSLPRPQLEELRSLSSPPRIIREVVGLLHSMLQLSQFPGSLENICWETVASVLQRDELVNRIATFSPPGSKAEALLSSPVIREILEVMDRGRCIGNVKQVEHRWKQMRAPNSARAAKSVASSMAAQLFVIKPPSKSNRGSMPATPRQRLVFRSYDDSDVLQSDAGNAGLINYIRDGSSLDLQGVASSLPPAVDGLLQWMLTQLRYLKLRTTIQGDGKCAETEMKHTREEAEESLLELTEHEAHLARELVCTLDEPAYQATSAEVPYVGVVEKRALETLVEFPKGSAIMSSTAVMPLLQLVEGLRVEAGVQLVVLGHGSEEEGEELHMKRAQTVVQVFRAQGLNADRFTVLTANGPSRVKFAVATPILLQEPLLFAACSDSLSPEAEEDLLPVVELLKDAPFLKISIEGHADNGPMWLGNVALSDGRAGRVSSCLQRLGVEQDKIQIVSHGDRQPLAPNDDAEGKAKNRRVELKVLPGESAKNLRSARRRSELPAEKTGPRMLALALVAADICGNTLPEGLCGGGRKRSRLGSMLRQFATDELVAHGVHWAPHLWH